MRIKIMAESADHKEKSTPEWTHFIDVDDIQDNEMRLTISPDAEELKHLERRLGLEKLKNVSAKLKLKRLDRRVVKVIGSLEADVVQNCVVTLQPVEDHLEDSFEAWYADPEQAVSFARARHERDKDKGAEERPMLEEHEDPESIIDGRINVGELVTQYLSLSINPYPHSEEAQKLLEEEQKKNPAKDNPFAALKALKEEK